MAYTTVLSATHNNIDQLAWESYQNYTVLCPKRSTSVEGYHLCHEHVVSLVLQQYNEDDLLMVGIDTQYYDSHYKTVHER